MKVHREFVLAIVIVGRLTDNQLQPLQVRSIKNRCLAPMFSIYLHLNFVVHEWTKKSVEGEVIQDIETLEDGSLKITGEPTDYNAIKTAIESSFDELMLMKPD